MDPVSATMALNTGAKIGSTVMVESVKALYGISKAINDFLNKHINEMKGAENPTISRSGRVLEMAKHGFGIGYITPVVIIATGQLLLGNTLAAVSTAATTATLTNPIAMTCASIGAIYYGWGALTDQERNEMIEKLSKGLEIGVELIRSILMFVIDKTKELLSSKNFEEIKKYIGSAAEVFGKSLSDVTHKLTDMVSDTYDAIKETAGDAVDKTIDISSSAYETVKESAGDAVDKTIDISSNIYESVKETAGKAANGTQDTIAKIKSKPKVKKIE